MTDLLLALMIGQCGPAGCPVVAQPAAVYTVPSPAYVIAAQAAIPPQPQYEQVLVRVSNNLGDRTHTGSGVILTRSGLVLTCRHIWDEGVGKITVRRPDGRAWEGRLVTTDDREDLSAVQIADPGPIPKIRYAIEQPVDAVLVGFPGGGRFPVIKEGIRLTQSVRYSFVAEDGDSGGPIFAPNSLILSGVVWGSTGRMSYATDWYGVNSFLKRRCFSFFNRNNSPNNLFSGVRLFSPDRRQYFNTPPAEFVAYAPPPTLAPLPPPAAEVVPIPSVQAPPRFVPVIPSPQVVPSGQFSSALFSGRVEIDLSPIVSRLDRIEAGLGYAIGR